MFLIGESVTMYDGRDGICGSKFFLRATAETESWAKVLADRLSATIDHDGVWVEVWKDGREIHPMTIAERKAVNEALAHRLNDSEIPF